MLISVLAKVEGMRKELTRIDGGMRILKSSDEKGSEIKLYTISPEKLESIKRQLRLVKIPIHEIKTGRYVDAREQFFLCRCCVQRKIVFLKMHSLS